MTTENKPRTLEELIAKHHGETVEFSNAELIASLIAWHKAALERYGAKSAGRVPRVDEVSRPEERRWTPAVMERVVAREKAARMAALEESCPLVCGHCRDGDAAQLDNLNGIYVHGERRGACFANGIRVLIEKEKE